MYDQNAIPSKDQLATYRPGIADNWRIYAKALPDYKSLPDLRDIGFEISWNPGDGFRFEPNIGQFEDNDPDSLWSTIEEAYFYLIMNREKYEQFEQFIQFLEKYAHTHLTALNTMVANHPRENNRLLR